MTQTTPTLRIQGISMVPASTLKPHPKNPNIHTAEQIERLAKIIEFQGWRYPIKVSARSGFVTSGHGRLEAAKLRGWHDVPVSLQEYDSQEQEFADVVSDNAIASWSELDLTSIKTELGHFPDLSIDLLGIEGFEPAKLVHFGPPGDEPKDEPDDDDDDVEPPPPRSQVGERYLVGRHMVACGDNIDILKTLSDNSVDAVVTDPPYGWRFMGQAWDGADIERVAKAKERGGVMADGLTRKPRDLPAESAGTYDQSLSANKSFELWTKLWATEALRVLKPGGHMLVFCGPRTYHRMASGVEDAGFEIRDQLQWIFGSGFPKSMDVSKAIDKAAGAEREVVGPGRQYADEGGAKDRRWEGGTTNQNISLTAPTTDYAKQWQGWGTALKPANEPIVLARKPLSESTVAKNVLKWGTGALNIDGSRVKTSDNLGRAVHQTQSWKNTSTAGVGSVNDDWKQGRWPANVIFDEAAAEMLDEQSGERPVSGSAKLSKPHAGEFSAGFLNGVGKRSQKLSPNDSGGASRFFYCAKTSKAERNRGLEQMPLVESGIKNDSGRGFSESDPHKVILNQNHHATVKPVRLMEYLIKMIVPPDGVVLEPFGGSGTTLVAAERCGVNCYVTEREPGYVDIILARAEKATGKQAVLEAR